MSTLTDYKFVWIRRDDDGTVTALVRIYEGDETTEVEEDVDDITVLVPVTRYRRTALLRELTVNPPGRPSDNALRGLVNAELAQDLSRTPIDEQKVGGGPP